jgi:Ca-activated chloride channel family protein
MSEVQFGNTELLHLIWVVLALGVLVYVMLRRIRRDTVRFTALHHALAAISYKRGRLKLLLVFAALVLMVIALGRPAWDPQPMPVQQEGRDVVFLIDVSQSMLAQDLSPSRLERAKLAIINALSTIKGDRVALVAFAGEASLVVPLTRDYSFFKWAVRQLSPADVPRGGTVIGDAVRMVTNKVFDPEVKRYKDIVLISDGEDKRSFPIKAATVAGQQGVRMLSIGLGDDGAGSRIPVTNDSGETRYLQENGQPIRSRLQGDTLRQMARATPGGRYLHVATGAFDLGQIYGELIASKEGRSFGEVTLTRYQERFQWFLAVALVLLLAEMLIPSRRTAKTPATEGGGT